MILENLLPETLPRGYVGPVTDEEREGEARIEQLEKQQHKAWAEAVSKVVAEVTEKHSDVVADLPEKAATSILRQVALAKCHGHGEYDSGTHPYFAQEREIQQEVQALRREVQAIRDLRIGPPEFEGMRQLVDFDRPETRSESFKWWFGQSAVVDPAGRPLIVFHGSNRDLNEFATDPVKRKKVANPDWHGMLGSWFAAPSSSSSYEVGNAESTADWFAESHGTDGAAVYPVYLAIQKPYEFEDYEELSDDCAQVGGAANLRAKLIRAGYDGIVVTECSTDGNQYRADWVAFYPAQIKSALSNVGTFDPQNPDIRLSVVAESPEQSPAAAVKKPSAIAPGKLPSSELKKRVLDLTWGNKGIKRLDTPGMLAAVVNRNGRPVFVVDGNFGRNEFKAALAEAEQAGLEFDKIYVFADSGTYSGRSIDFMRLDSVMQRTGEPESASQPGASAAGAGVDGEAFKTWFGGSKAVDSQGKPLVVYHGTHTPDFSQFDPSFSEDGSFHFGTSTAAWDAVQQNPDYEESHDSPALMPVYLSIQNPMRVNDQDANWSAIILEAKSKGHDGLIYENAHEDKGSDSYIVFNPTQIKSAIGNNGNFDPKSPDIRFSVIEAEQGDRPVDDTSPGVLFFDDNENAIVFERGDLRISVDKPGDASHVVLWANQETDGKALWRKAGVLDANTKTKTINGVRSEYLGVSSIEIQKAYRGRGMGLEMYRALIAHAAPHIAGIISHTPDRANKQQVPHLYQKLGAFTDGDNQIIPIQRNEPTAPQADVRLSVINGEAGGVPGDDISPRDWIKLQGTQVADASGNPLLVYHGSRVQIDAFDAGQTVDGGLHFGNKAQASMRASKHLAAAYLDAKKLRRSKDLGGNWKAKIQAARSDGYDGIVYLNRYEGISLETVLRVTSADLDTMTDAQFRKFVPEAQDSYIVFDAKQVVRAVEPAAPEAHASSDEGNPRNPDIRFSVIASEPDGRAVVDAPSVSENKAAIATFNRVMHAAGWEVEYVDMDLTADKPKVDIRVNRDDGRFLIAKVDSIGRASFETFQRERSLRMDESTKGRRPLSPMIDDTFLGRQKFEGARSMLRGMATYLMDNASSPVALADMRSAWAGIMSAPVKQDGAPVASLLKAPVESAAAGADVVASEPLVFHEDIPNEQWLAQKVAYAVEDGRNQWGVPRFMGPVTGRFSRQLNLPVSLLASVPGARGEQDAIRQDSLVYIRANWDELIAVQKPFIMVDPFGKAWVNEGNHRIMVAAERGLTHLPVEVRYFSGGQRYAEELSPATLVQLDAEYDAAQSRQARCDLVPEPLDGEALARCERLPGLRNSAGASYTFWKLASAALGDVDGDAASVDWRAVEAATIRESVCANGQSHTSVFDALCRYSPGAVSEERQKAILELAQTISEQHGSGARPSDTPSLTR